VTKIVRERRRSSFYLTKDTFDAIAVSVAFVSVFEPVATTRCLQRYRAIDEKDGVADVVFLAKFGEESICENVRSRRLELRVE